MCNSCFYIGYIAGASAGILSQHAGFGKDTGFNWNNNHFALQQRSGTHVLHNRCMFVGNGEGEVKSGIVCIRNGGWLLLSEVHFL